MPRKGRFIRENSSRSRAPGVDARRWSERIAAHLSDTGGLGIIDQSLARKLGQDMVGMFEAGARDSEVAGYLQESLGAIAGRDFDWLTLATSLHRLASA
jgi:hypothetical protein